MIWERILKIHYVGLDKLELGVYDAIASFNYGKQACLDIFENMNVDLGIHMKKMCGESKQRRKSSSIYIYKATDSCKKTRKLKGARKMISKINLLGKKEPVMTQEDINYCLVTLFVYYLYMISFFDFSRVRYTGRIIFLGIFIQLSNFHSLLIKGISMT